MDYNENHVKAQQLHPHRFVFDNLPQIRTLSAQSVFIVFTVAVGPSALLSDLIKEGNKMLSV